MITYPTAATVLCFGDSNTHGAPSDDDEYVRLTADVRWTGRLQRLLGDGYDVIEEGLSGRTTDLEYDDCPGCNGRPYFWSSLLSHGPLEVVVVMLGTNDLKTRFGRTAADIATALHGYLDDVQAAAVNRAGQPPKMLLVSPIHLDDTRPGYLEMSSADFDAHSVEESRRLATEIATVAKARGVGFVDAASVAHPGRDGLHLSLDSHQSLADVLAHEIRRLTLPR